MEASDRPATQSQRPSRPNLAHALPTKRLAFPKQLEILRGYAVAGADGAAVQNRQLAQLVGMSHKTTSLANAFFLENELLRRVEGGFRPSPEVISFQQAHQWNPDEATRELAPVLIRSWFANALLPQLRMRPLSVDEAVTQIGRAANAGPENRHELGMILDYLVDAGIVRQDGDRLRATDDRAAQEPDGGRNHAAHAVEEPEHHHRPTITSSHPSPASSGNPSSRGPMPLLIQGLLEQLPREGRWTQAKADQWLELARMTFNVVYQLDDKPSAGQRHEGEP